MCLHLMTELQNEVKHKLQTAERKNGKFHNFNYRFHNIFLATDRTK